MNGRTRLELACNCEAPDPCITCTGCTSCGDDCYCTDQLALPLSTSNTLENR